MKLLPLLESIAFLLACVVALRFVVTRAALWWVGEVGRHDGGS